MGQKMKHSKIEWIGEIPDDWEIINFGNLLKEHKMPNQRLNTIALQFKFGTIIRKKERGITPEIIEMLSNYNVVEPNNIMINGLNLAFDFITQRVAIVKEKGVITSTYIAIMPTTNYCPQYATYLLKSYDNQKVFHALGRGLRCMLSYDILKREKVLYPPLYEQQKIADYLDKKCAAVDRLIENQRAQIEKLKEYKQSVITEAVTRGLDPSAPMKDSGVEWIGNICERFELRRLKEVAQILDEYRKPITADLRSQDAEILYDYYGASGVIDKIDGYTIDDHIMLIGEDGANLKMRNLPLMYEVNGKAWINNHAHILKPCLNMDFYYLFYCLESLDINPYITGSAQPKLSQENLRNIHLPVPPLEEQQQIADYLDKKCAKIDKLISIKQQKIETLTEYKKSLIYEYVTGKKEVG